MKLREENLNDEIDDDEEELTPEKVCTLRIKHYANAYLYCREYGINQKHYEKFLLIAEKIKTI